MNRWQSFKKLVGFLWRNSDKEGGGLHHDETIGRLTEIKLLTKPELTTTPVFGPVSQVIAAGSL